MPKKSTPPKQPDFVSWPTVALLLLLLLVSGCKTLPQTPPSVPVRSVQVPPLPSYAIQPTTPSECLPSCLEWLTAQREEWLRLLQNAGRQGLPASEDTTPSEKP